MVKGMKKDDVMMRLDVKNDMKLVMVLFILMLRRNECREVFNIPNKY